MADDGLKGKTFEQNGNGASNPVREYKRYTYLQNVSHWKLFVFHEKRLEDLRMLVLLTNADRYIKQSVAQLPELVPNEIPSEGTSWTPLPGSWNQEGKELLLEEMMEMTSNMMYNSRTGMNIGMDTGSEFSSSCQGQMARRNPSWDNPLVDLFPSTGEGLLRDPGLDVAGPLLHLGEDLSSSVPEGRGTNPMEETCVWNALSQEELLCDSLFGSFGILTDNYLQDFPLDDVFTDIDTSAFDSIPVPSSEQPHPVCTKQEKANGLRTEVVHLANQNLSSGADPMELLFNSE